MFVAVSIYQAVFGRGFRLSPMCPGLFGWTIYAQDAGKGRERVLERLRREIKALEPSAVGRLFIPAGRRLERVRLELTLHADSGEGGKRNVAGVFPVVVEPRSAGGGRELVIAYHPQRPNDWFEIQASAPLADQVRRAYARIFDPDDAVDRIKSDGREKLVSLRFDAAIKSPLAFLPKPDQDGKLSSGSPDAQLEQLLRVAVNETARAADGSLHLGLPREALRRRLQQLVCGVQKTPLIVVGPPRSGKSTLIAQTVRDLLDADDYPSHRNLDRAHNVLSLRGRHLIAGMSYVGQWEARAMALLERAKKKKLVLWVDDIHAWGSIGKTTVSERALADFFRGPVARRELLMIGECTPEQLTLLEHEAPAFADAFAKVPVEPASPEQTVAMMLHESRRLEQELDVVFDPRTFRRIIELGTSLFRTAAFPGKAIAPLHALSRARPAPANDGPPVPITPEDAVRHFSTQTGLPSILLAPEAPLERSTLLRELGQLIMGQDAALDAGCDLILSLRMGACDRGRPYGVFLFTGPTGTGKTELAQCIAEYLYGTVERLLRFDMGELGTPDAPSRLIGDRFEPQGRLTQAVLAQPFCVLLLDEIEKAHPSVLNLMLQIFDDGRLTDARGTVTDFTHSVIIMTSNLGSGARKILGFADNPAAINAEIAAAVRDFFPPELFNRIDRVVAFQPLDREAARRIAAKELARLAGRPGLAERNVFVRFTPAVVDAVVDAGYSAEYGARALKRYIDREVGDLLAQAVTRERSADLRVLWLYRGKSGLSVHVEALREAEPTSRESLVEALLREDRSARIGRIPAALSALGRMEQDGRLEALSREITRELAGFRLGDGQRADQVYDLDALRAHVAQLKRRLESRCATDAGLQELERRRKQAAGEELAGDDFSLLGDRFGMLREHPERRPRFESGSGASSGRFDRSLLADLAEVVFLERTLAHATEPGEHVVLIELLRSAAHYERRRFSRGNPGLLEWLARAYLRSRGQFETGAARFHDGTLRPLQSAKELEEALESRPERLALRLVGPGVSAFLAGEAGSHVRRAAGAGPEIIQVHVVRGNADPVEHLAQHDERRHAFERALEQGIALPDHSARLLPIVRQVRFDGALDRASRAEIEDYRFSHAAARQVRDLSELLVEFWLLAAGRSAADVLGGEQS